MPRTRTVLIALAAAAFLAAGFVAAVTHVPAAACGAGAAPIGRVQGSGSSSPIAGRTATVVGTVVGDEPGLSGYFVEDRGDGDPRTSDGVFVYAPGASVALGDRVAATGTVTEYRGLTELARSSTRVCRTGTARDLPHPAALRLPASDDERERIEGMLVSPVEALTVSGVQDLARYGELTLSSDGVLVRPTEIARPGAAAAAVGRRNAQRSIVLDDGSSARAGAADPPYLTSTTPVRVGDPVRFSEPLVLSYGYGEWLLEPADGSAKGTIAAQDTRPTAPRAVGGDLRIAQFNVENYFLTRGAAGRGAATDADFARQAAKTVAAIRGLHADVLTLEELEDTDSTGYSPGDADIAVADLVRRLNTTEGAGSYAYVPLPKNLYSARRDVIRTAIVYRPAAVRPVGASVGWTDGTVWSNARQPIAQRFEAHGDTFIVIGTHFKSKSGSGATGDDADTGQGAFDGDRVREAASLARLVTSLESTTGVRQVLALGDFNAYTEEDPIVDLGRDGLADLGSPLDPGRYGYVFDARSGSLDHALATPAITARVTGLAHWPIDAEESAAYAYDGDPALYSPAPYRASDHDPLVLGLRL